MAVKFANRMNLLKGSEIRALLALTAKPEVISFAGGMPAPELFPTEGVKEAACKVMDNMGRVALQYTGTDGFASLREKIVARMAAKNDIHVSIDDILITSGSQQGLDFSARVFLNPGDVVLVESPSYLGAINAFKACEPTFVEVPTDDAGMIPEELDKILATTENVKMIYVIPDFQNPTGKTWTLERRQKFMELINKYEIPVIEDNPYGELRFEGEFLPSLKSMDTKDLVIFLGTMSKIFAPGLRIGWVCSTNAEVLGKYNFIKQGADLQSSTIDQLITNQFLEDNDLDAHVEKIKAVYVKRRDAMLKTMEETFPKEVKFTHPEGGLFTWCVLPEYMDAKVIAPQCLEKNVAYVPGGSFFPNGGKENHFRLNYSCMPEDKIVEGITKIAEVLKANLTENQALLFGGLFYAEIDSLFQGEYNGYSMKKGGQRIDKVDRVDR